MAINGALYHANGRIAARQYKVEIFSPGEDLNLVANIDGIFTAVHLDRWPSGCGVRVNGHKVPKQRIVNKGDRLIVIMPKDLGTPDNQGGGVITGTVFKNEAPYPEAKVEAQVISSSFLGIFGSEEAKTVTDRHGRFTLEVPGGIEVKNLFAGSKQPEEMIVKGQSQPWEGKIIPVGTFGLQIKARSKFLGMF